MTTKKRVIVIKKGINAVVFYIYNINNLCWNNLNLYSPLLVKQIIANTGYKLEKLLLEILIFII